MTKTIDTLIEDIDAIFTDPDHEVNPDNIEVFGENVKGLLKKSLEEAGSDRDFTIRMSNYGTPIRKLWYENKCSKEGTRKNNISPATYRKFLFGHILEELLNFFVKEAGHTLSDEQKEVTVNGVLGHIDGKIDGEMVDVKSASTFSFGKFKNRSLLQNDPFGYIAQMSGYTHAEGHDRGFFFVIDKQHGSLHLMEVDEFDLIDSEERIDNIREALEEDTPPDEKCYAPKVEKNGNEELNSNCYFCPHIEDCWKDSNNGKGVRWFKYSDKPRGLIKVVKTPRVEEIIK